jgi:hypothetical protein
MHRERRVKLPGTETGAAVLVPHGNVIGSMAMSEFNRCEAWMSPHGWLENNLPSQPKYQIYVACRKFWGFSGVPFVHEMDDPSD